MTPFALFNLSGREVALLAGLAIPALLVTLYALVAGYVARQAKRRGYSFWLWFVAQIVSLNPLLVLIVLAILPDANKMALRQKLLAELETKLADRPRPAAPEVGIAVSPRSVGDQTTAVPPQLRSVGDVETRA
jgi:hypothetical protein